MSSRFTDDDIADQFRKLSDHLVELLAKCGALGLVPGAETVAGRTQWTVTNDGTPMLALGYTRREAMKSLVAMNNVLSLIE